MLQMFGLVLAVVCAAPVAISEAWAQNETGVIGEEVDNIVEQVSVDESGVISVQGSIASTTTSELLYLQAVISDESGVTRDRIQSQQAVTPGSDYNQQFDFSLSPVTSDKIVLLVVTQDGVPQDIDPLRVEWSSNTPQFREGEMLDIIACHLVDDSQDLSCSFEGPVDVETATVRLYEGQPYTGVQIQEVESDVRVDSQALLLEGITQPAEDGLYTYTITNESGVVLHQGSVRTGVIPEFAQQNSPEELAQQTQREFVMMMGALVLAFITIIVMLSQYLLNPKPSRWIWIGAGALMLMLLGVWQFAYADTYESTNYPQYVYTVDAEAISSTINDEGVRETTYWISFSAFDTYTGTAPMSQKVDITLNGTDYQELVRNESGETVHTREVVITEDQEDTAAVRVMDGCGSYYGFSEMGADRYGKYTCDPYVLFSEDAVVGCIDPNAANYDSSATIASDTCEYEGCTFPAAANYDPQATIDDGSCEIAGCMNPAAANYDSSATYDDGSCDYIIADDAEGCTNPEAVNYSETATIDDGSCTFDVYGCTNPSSPNYNENATVDDGSCGNCLWSPYVPDPSTFCTTEVYYQTNSCTGEVRQVQGMLNSQWLPDIKPSDVCAGEAMTQVQQC
jgi:hypothetical protein